MSATRWLSEFGFATHYTTWSYSVTRSVASDARRTQWRRAELMSQRPHGAEATAAEPKLDEGRLLGLVREQLAALPARQRKVFDLVDLQGRAPAEVAELL